MPNGNGQGPMNAGSKTGRGRGFCSGSGMPGAMNRDTLQPATEEQQRMADCHGPKNCATGMKAGNGRRGGGGCGNVRGQR